MNNILTNSGMSNSTSKPEPLICESCGEERPMTKVQHPFKDEIRWAHCACPCKIKEMEDFDREQKSKSRRIRINKLLKLSSSMDDIKEMTFNNYKKRNGAESSYEEVVKAVKNFKERGKEGVFIFGETGNGKSHLTAAGGNELINQGYAVIFITEKDLFSRLLATKNFNNEESFHEIMGACLDADLLIWDDFLSSQKLSNDEKDYMFQIINGRERANKPIWYTSNITPDEFQSDATAYKLDDKGRTWWRIIGNNECVFNRAKNYRKSVAMAKTMGISIDEYERKVN
ncbi:MULTISPECIES: ATP-binding protein [unclassified Oceanobacillus]|uniref:ATP-binding protein n=1 Tax=unclassified Oceanobacillus TaxID=2630292 RepID=UPI002035B32F|nr:MULTISPECIES: ATP-binding protein [unclassified Oceanobacillus]